MTEPEILLDEAMARVRRAIGGDTGGFASTLAAARAQTGVPDAEVPPYLPRALAALAAGTHASATIDPAERGWAWLLRDLVPILPGAELIDDSDRDGVAIPALGRALVIERGDERWSVIAWPPPVPEPAHRVLDTFDPTEAQIRAWAYDPGLAFTAQDEELAIEHPSRLALLIELAGDPACPKGARILSILDRIVGLPRPGAIALMTRARDLARARDGSAELAAWADDLDRVLTYGRGRGPVTLDEARGIARQIMLGRARPALVLDETPEAGGWTFQARFPDGGGPLDRLHVDAATGNLVWAPRPDVPLPLADIAHLPSRLAALDPELAPA